MTTPTDTTTIPKAPPPRPGRGDAMKLVEFDDVPRACDKCTADFVGKRYQRFCPPCQIAVNAELERREAERQREARDYQLSEATASIPPRFRWAHWHASDLHRRVHDVDAIKAARAATGSVVLMGPTGAGKSTLACCILRGIIDAARPVDLPSFGAEVNLARGARFVTARELAFARASGTYGQEPPIVAHACDATVLVLDDVGQDAVRADSSLYDVLEARHNRNVPTIVTTGLDEGAIRARYGDGAWRRIFEGATDIEVRLAPKGTR